MASTLTITVAGNPVNFVYGSWKLQRQIDQQDRCSFTVIDSTGTANFQKRQPVVVSDSVQGTLWTGYVDKARASKLPPQPHRLWTIDCTDQTYLPNKRTSNKIYANQYAGTIVADQVQRYLASEGVTGDFALDWDELEADFVEGTLTNVIPTTNSHDGNNGDGDLELALSGTDLVYILPAVSMAPTMGLKLVGTAVQGVNNNYVYRKIWQGTPITIQAGDHLDYEIWISSTSPQIMAGVDFVCTDGTTFRDSPGAGTDAQGILPHPKIDLDGYANDQWYFRSFGVGSPLIGKTLQYVSVAFEGDNQGTYTAYFKNIYFFKTGGTVQQIIFDNTMTAPQLNNLISVNGYTNVSLTALETYEPLILNDTTVSIDQVNLVKGSYISWNEDKNAHYMLASMDNGSSGVQIHSGDSIPYLTPGMNVTGRSLVFFQSTILGTDPSSVSQFPPVKLTVYTSYNATKSDSITQYGESNTAFSTGTFTDTKDDGGNNLTINGFTRDYDDAFYGSQTAFGNGVLNQAILMRQFYLQTTAGTELRSRMDFAGTWNNFTAEVDIKVTVNGNLGLEYRTTTWSNTLNTYAYNAFVTPTAVTLGKGTNGGGGGFTSLQTASAAFADGSWHRLKVVVSGSSHSVYVDDVLYFTKTDASYNGTSQVALRFFNSSASTQAAYFDNFGIVSNLIGTWTSPSINIAGPSTYGTSVIFWDTLIIPDTTSITAQSSIDGGSTWQALTNGGAISGLTAGQSLSGKTLKLKLTLTAANASVLPTVEGATAWILGQFSASGTRVSPALPLAPVGRAGTSLVNWNKLTPTNTSVAISTSIDGGATYQSVASAGNAISGITMQSTPTVDTFSTSTSANYTFVNSRTSPYVMRAFGSTLRGLTLTWTWDTANSRLIATGGTNAMLLLNSPSSTNEVATFIDLSRADAVGIILNYLDSNNFFYCEIHDNSAASNAGKAFMYKVSSGTALQLGSTVTINFVRGTYHRFQFTNLSGLFVLSMDATPIISFNQAPFGGINTGKVGVWNNGGTAYIYQFSVQPQGQRLGDGSYQATVQDDGAIRYYPANEAIGTIFHDLGSQAQNGTIHGNLTLQQKGLLAECMDASMLFGGSSGYISLPTTNLPSGASPWTLECWINIPTLPSAGNYPGVCILGTQGSSLHGVEWYFDGDDAHLYLWFEGADQIASLGVLTANTTYHLMATYDGVTISFYLNGQLQGTLARTLNITFGNAYIASDGAHPFPGIVDEFNIYPSCLSDGRNAVHYSSSLSGIAAYKREVFADSPLRSYHLSELSGTTARDYSGNGQDGTLHGGVTPGHASLIADGDAAALLDGSSAYITAPTTGLPTGANPWTLECWIKPTSILGRNTTLIQFGGSGDVYLYYHGSSGLLALFAQTTEVTGLNLQAGSIYYIAGQYDGANLLLYIGDPATGFHSYSTSVGTLTLGSSAFYIGNDPFNEFFAGIMGKIAVYPTVLTADQIKTHFIAGVGLLTKVTLTSTDATVTPALLDIQTFVAGPAIGAGTLIPSANYQKTFVSSNVADLNKQSNYWWNVDPLTKKIIFQARNAQPSPWIIASANASTQIGSQTIGDVLVDNLTLENSGDAYRNRQTLKGVKATGAFDKPIIGNGKATSWTLDYPVATDTVPTVKLNNQSQTVGIKGVASGKNFYYQVGSTSLEQDGSGTVLQDTDSLLVSYTGAYTTDLTFDNTGQPMYAGTVSQAQMAAITGTSGIDEAVEDVSNQNMDVPTATTYAQQLLLRFGVIGQTLTYKTLRQGLAPGQQVPVFVPEQATNDVQFLISSLEITATQGQDASGNSSVLYWYAVTALTGPMLGTWVRMFANALKGT